MLVSDILKAKGNDVHTIVPGAMVVEAVHRLSGPPRIGALVVVATDGRVLGLLTERDVIRAMAERRSVVFDLQVADVMSRGGPTCVPSDTVTGVMAEMTRSRFRHLPVMSGGRLSGLVSIGDLVKYRLDELQMEADVLRDVYISGR